MKDICILVSEQTDPLSVTGTQAILNVANEFYRKEKGHNFFGIKLVGISRHIQITGTSLLFEMDDLAENILRCDLIIIPALGRDIQKAVHTQNSFLQWITGKYKSGAEVASLCTGSFLLAETGLVDGKMCSTHWSYANEFRSMYPSVQLVDDKVITDQNGLYSSGGSVTSWNLLLYLIEKYISRELAITISKYFLLDIDKTSQLPFSIFLGQKEHGDEIVLAAQKYMEVHTQEKLKIEEVAGQFNLARRTFERRFRKATSNTATEYLHRVKVERAKKQLEAGRSTINEVMYDVGYSDTKAFRDIFKRYVGMSPVDYKEKYRKVTERVLISLA